jgi:hypothetical protein
VGGFGRKGLEGQPQPTGFAAPGGIEELRNSARSSAQQANPAMASRVDGFLASERQRAREAGVSGVSRAGVSDFAFGHRDSAGPERSLVIAYLLWFILGQVSAHRFYLGAYRSAIAQVGLFAFWLLLALSTPEGAENAVGPVLALAVIGWALWILADVFFIYRIHRRLCRQASDAAAAFA